MSPKCSALFHRFRIDSGPLMNFTSTCAQLAHTIPPMPRREFLVILEAEWKGAHKLVLTSLEQEGCPYTSNQIGLLSLKRRFLTDLRNRLESDGGAQPVNAHPGMTHACNSHERDQFSVHKQDENRWMERAADIRTKRRTHKLAVVLLHQSGFIWLMAGAQERSAAQQNGNHLRKRTSG